MRKFFVLSLLILISCQCALFGIPPRNLQKIVTSTKRIFLQDFPGAYNPSIIQFEGNYLLTFRYLPNRFEQPWISQIGIVVLDPSFEQISDPVLIDTRFNYNNTPSQSEDARIFAYNGKLYLIYNDNMDLVFPSPWERRDMFIAELIYSDNEFVLCDPIKLYHETKYQNVLWQKNWSPFEWNGNLFLTYTINPHEILCPNLATGVCQSTYETFTPKALNWHLGPIRGGTPPIFVNGEYLAFFHSGIKTSSASSNNVELWHYYMGAYTFSAEPPFELTKISSSAIIHPSFYTYSTYEKRVIYPGGFVVDGPNLHVAYGKDDCEIWIATMNYQELKKSMVTIKSIDYKDPEFTYSNK